MEKYQQGKISEEKTRVIVVPGEVIASGESYLPGDNTKREDKDIIANKFGLAEKEGRLVKVIPLAEKYMPRKGNVVIGKIIDVTFSGWIVDINSCYSAFLSVKECAKFLNKNNLIEYLDFGDMIIAEVLEVRHRAVDLTLKARGLGKIENGIIIKINSSKVPRVIGRGGSMVNMIKHESECRITVGQNGIAWIKGEKLENELLAKEAIMLIATKPFVEGLTEKIKKFLESKK